MNKKFIHYGKKATPFSKKQKERLVASGFLSIHIPEGQMKDLLRYRLQFFLDQKITQHKKTVRLKNASSF